MKHVLGGSLLKFVRASSTAVLVLGLSLLPANQAAQSASLHLTASSPWRSYADPLGPDSGVPLLPAIFDALTLIDVDGNLVPALAKSWSNNGDTVWTFKLQSGIVFSDGAPLTAQAVVDSLSLQIGATGLTYSTARYTSGISGVRVLSDDEIEVTTAQKDARLARKLSNVNVFNVAAYDRLGRTEFSKFPVGTGPFKPESWSNDGKGVVLSSVPTSWRASRQVDRVEFIVVPDASARLQSLLSNGTDISNNIDPDMIPTVENAGYKVSIRPGPIILGLALRTGEGAAEPLKDPQVRHALNLAVNRQSITDNLLLGTMQPATQFATSEALGYDASLEPYSYNPDRARKLLTEAGYSDGFDLTGVVMTGQFPGDTLIFQQVAQDLSAIGVKVELGTLPVVEFIRRRNASTWDGVDLLSTNMAHYRLGDISLAAEYYTCGDPRTTFCDPVVDDLYLRSNQEMDPTVRKNTLQTLNARLHLLNPAIVVTRYASVDALSKRLVRIPESPAGIMRFELMELIDD